MKHDFQNARRGAVIQTAGKTRVTMYLDDDVIEFFRARATSNGRGYQTEINACLREALEGGSKKVQGVVVKKGMGREKGAMGYEVFEAREIRNQLSCLMQVVERVEGEVSVVRKQVGHLPVYVYDQSGKVSRVADLGELVTSKGPHRTVFKEHSGGVAHRGLASKRPGKRPPSKTA
jgi:hypothetical protein